MSDLANTLTWVGQMPVASPETAPFWEACNRDKFLIQRCDDCGKTQYHYRALCCHCWSSNVRDVVAAGTGTVWTFSVVEKNRSPVIAFPPPYVVGLIELDEGPRVFG